MAVFVCSWCPSCDSHVTVTWWHRHAAAYSTLSFWQDGCLVELWPLTVCFTHVRVSAVMQIIWLKCKDNVRWDCVIDWDTLLFPFINFALSLFNCGKWDTGRSSSGSWFITTVTRLSFNQEIPQIPQNFSWWGVGLTYIIVRCSGMTSLFYLYLLLRLMNASAWAWLLAFLAFLTLSFCSYSYFCRHHLQVFGRVRAVAVPKQCKPATLIRFVIVEGCEPVMSWKLYIISLLQLGNRHNAVCWDPIHIQDSKHILCRFCTPQCSFLQCLCFN